MIFTQTTIQGLPDRLSIYGHKALDMALDETGLYGLALLDLDTSEDETYAVCLVTFNDSAQARSCLRLKTFKTLPMANLAYDHLFYELSDLQPLGYDDKYSRHSKYTWGQKMPRLMTETLNRYIRTLKQ